MDSPRNVLAVLALQLLGGVDAFWRMNCAPIMSGRIDPIVNPGAVAAHAHAIVGASNIGVNATYASLVNSECTSCEIGGDKSAYWTPILYYQYPNGSFLEVPHGGSVIYYLGRGPNNSTIIPYPKGFKILTGDKGARSYDNVTYSYGTGDYPGRPIADRVSFACLADPAPLPEQPYMFNTDCAYGMRAQIVYQSCWNGIDLYKPDNSHVAYLSGLDNGICPPDHPYQLPTLFIETLWSVNSVPGKTTGGQFVFSQGDPTGYGFHADFINGWESSVLQSAVANCLVPDNFGQVSACPALQRGDSNGYPFNCPERPPQIGEQLSGLLSALPGCINITYGPAEAPAASMNCPPSVPQPSITTTVDSTPRPTALPNYGQQYGLANNVYLGCFNDSTFIYRTLNEAFVSNYTVMTVEYCQQFCKDRGYRLSGVEFAQECHCDNFINPTAVNGSDQCTWNCGGTMTLGVGTQELCGGLQYINVYNNTDPNFNAFGDVSDSAGYAQPYAPPAPFAANYLGCYTDSSSSGRALTGINQSLRNMSIEICAAFCSNGVGYQYYGLEFGTQCYCGNTITNNNTLLTPTTSPDNTTCSMRCQGSEPEICGGASALSVYNNTGYVAPGTKASTGKYVAKKCLTDPGNGGLRALGGPRMAGATLTEESCVKFCLGQGMHFAGMEYADECYCGNSISYDSGAQMVDCDVTKLMFCAGNTYEYCGGPSLLTLFYSATL